MAIVLTAHILFGFFALFGLIAVFFKILPKEIVSKTQYSFCLTLLSGLGLMLIGASITRFCISGVIFSLAYLILRQKTLVSIN